MSQTSPAVRVYSAYQEAIFRAFTQGTGNVVVEAVAGSGKTTTMVEALKRWQQVDANKNKRAVFCAFNKSIATELEKKVPAGVTAKTLHGLAFGAVARTFKGIKVDDRKLAFHAEKVLPMEAFTSREALRAATHDLTRAYGLLKGTLTSLQDIDAVAHTLATYGVELDANIADLPLPQLDQAMRGDTTGLTFDEMLSFILDHHIPMAKFDLVCVDEAQDMNRLQIELLKRLMAPGARFCAVGDSRQAIYGFRGADAEAMERIRREFNVSEGNNLPLSITYRCPRAVVAVAQLWVPHIQPSDTAAEGEVVHLDSWKKDSAAAFDALASGDMCVCRKNAPLVGAALKLLAQGRKAIVRGRDIGKNLTKLVDKLVKKLGLGDEKKGKFVRGEWIPASIDDSVAALFGEVNTWADVEGAKLRRAQKTTQAQQVEDQAETLMAIMRGAQSIDECKARIERLFSDDSVGVVFSSIHKAKGLEAPTVLWLGGDTTEEDTSRSQELNLCYVACTRAQQKLIILPLPEKDEKIHAHDDGEVA